MRIRAKRQVAEQVFLRGAALVQEKRYPEAIVELRRAEDLFRKLDVRGHAFSYTLENGISGLGNTLFQLGICHQMTGNFRNAIIAFETCTINERYERALPRRAFLRAVRDRLAASYEQVLERSGYDATSVPLPPSFPVDLSFSFPYSLDTAFIPAARLYELDPERYARFKPFYKAAQKEDASLRRTRVKTDDSTMRSISLSVWSILVAIWTIYGVVVVRALMHNK